MMKRWSVCQEPVQGDARPCVGEAKCVCDRCLFFVCNSHEHSHDLITCYGLVLIDQAEQEDKAQFEAALMKDKEEHGDLH